MCDGAIAAGLCLPCAPWSDHCRSLHANWDPRPDNAVGFLHLQHINLSKNSLARWTELRHLEGLPALHTLVLNENKLDDDLPDATVIPKSLTCLSLKYVFRCRID